MKLLFSALLFFSYLYAVPSEEIISDIYISKDGKNFYPRAHFNFKKEKFQNLFIQLKINKSYIKDKIYYMKVYCDVDNLIYTNTEHKMDFETLFIKLDKKSENILKFNFSYEKEQFVDFKFLFYDDFEFTYITKNEALLYGLAYGIMLTAILYNLVIFFNTREKSFLYYSLMQFVLMLTLFEFTNLAKQTLVSDSQQIIIDSLKNLCILLTIVFSKEILNTKKLMPMMNKILNFLIYINVIDFITILIFYKSLFYSVIPQFNILLFLVFVGLIGVYKGNRIAIFYCLGWFILFLSLYLSEQRLISIDILYVIHMGFPLESMILSFAIGYKLKKTIDEKKIRENILVHQSKLASMGEMINNIAHQWRQPLAHLSFINMDLQVSQECNDLKKEYLLSKLNESNDQIDFMSKTIDNFSDFYKPTKKKELFKISDAVYKAIDIIRPSLKAFDIDINFCIKKDKELNSYENEYSQVVLNLLTNAKDALLLNKIKNAKIEVFLKIENRKSLLIVEDNAGGIKPELLNKIFEPYFTTKEKSSGIGLYMSKIIVESHLKGEIKLSNTLKGVRFIIQV